MSYETRAYDNQYGNPVVVLVTTGTHDVSRLVNLLAGSRMALCEHMTVSQTLLRQVKRHNGGQAALKLLAAHGGPDFTEPDPLQAEVDRLNAELDRRDRIMKSTFDDLVNDRSHLAEQSLREALFIPAVEETADGGVDR